MKKLIPILFASTVLMSCGKKVEPIDYGEEICQYCSMTIVDEAHAAQLVTQKGKNYKFDSAECMIHFLEENKNEPEMLHILTADYNHPGNLIDVTTSIFLISDNVSSPMAANIAVFKTDEEAKDVQKKLNGKLFNWIQIKEQISLKPHIDH